MKRVKIVVRGDVQGVFYRHNAKKEAEKLGVKGWCRNEPDGSVYMIVEGADDKVERFVNWSKRARHLPLLLRLILLKNQNFLAKVVLRFAKYKGFNGRKG
jgi:acylphosphatase